jgi:hypothetical protein
VNQPEDHGEDGETPALAVSRPGVHQDVQPGAFASGEGRTTRTTAPPSSRRRRTPVPVPPPMDPPQGAVRIRQDRRRPCAGPRRRSQQRRPNAPYFGAARRGENYSAQAAGAGGRGARAVGGAPRGRVGVHLIQKRAAERPRSRRDDALVPVATLQPQFHRSLSAFTVQSIHGGSKTPQARAYRRLFASDDHPDLPQAEALERMLHRFALATLYYSTGGNGTWRTDTNWLDKEQHECLWSGADSRTDGASSISPRYRAGSSSMGRASKGWICRGSGSSGPSRVRSGCSTPRASAA